MSGRFLISGLALIIESAICYSQAPECIENHRRLGKASILVSHGDYPTALALWDTALAQGNYALWHSIQATEAALEHRDTARAMSYLEQVHSKGGQPLLAYSDPIKGLVKNGLSESDLRSIQIASEEWASKADSVWIKALLEMKALDQSHRGFDARTRHNDSLNLERLIALTEQRGFPTPAITGSSYGIVGLLLWHHRGELGVNERLEYFIELARLSMIDCHIEPDFLTGVIDFQAWERGQPMPYGTLIHFFRNSLEDVHLPDLETLNRNRESVGLGPIEDFAAMMDISLSALPLGR